ncbi:MAG: 4-alpha-glucanotransferase [Ignavibacteriales bacterium]|nr:4-alpha-glucanotransferase [Ignavibacteriales bacterium]
MICKISPNIDPAFIDYGEIIEYKKSLLKKAFINFKNHQEKFEIDFNKFCKENKIWLDDFAFFMAAKKRNGGIVWRLG